MQQREQLILKKLAEAREAQASAMTRFIQARARVMQVEARLRAVQARASQQQTTSPASSITPTQAAESAPALGAEDAHVVMPAFTLPSRSIPETPIPALDPAEVPLTPDLSALIDEGGLDALAHVLTGEPAPDQAVQDIPTVLLTEQTRPNEGEETKKQPTVPLLSPPVQQSVEEEETLLVSMSVLIAAREAREAAAQEKAAEQNAEVTSEDEASGTDITTKIPVIRRERREPRESS
ncbi:MAG TPA: hypothetical protein VF458_06425 [Ktedonobacteraceae bacterium]